MALLVGVLLVELVGHLVLGVAAEELLQRRELLGVLMVVVVVEAAQTLVVRQTAALAQRV